MNSYRKAKSVAKDVFVHGLELETRVLNIMKRISDAVGATLGPHGRPVLIERQEYGMPHMFTKDGVTVFRSLGYSDPTDHAIMEAARDASVRTASEAGDGTTTATVLAEAIVRNTSNYCKKNPRVSPQKVVRRLEQVFKDIIEPSIRSYSLKPTKEMLRSVAKLSANGDGALADAVMQCFDTVGDDGNITILEQSGPSGYVVESVKGYPLGMGYEESCGKYFPLFLNDKVNNRCYMEKPVFLLYYGAITQTQIIERLMGQVAEAWQKPELHNLDKPFTYNVVIVATGFSESVLTDLSVNFQHPHTIKVFPLLTPKTHIQNSEMHLLYDLAAVTGAKVFDPMISPIENATLGDLGYGISAFEVNRYRSSIFGICDESLIFARQDEIKGMDAESKVDKYVIEERVAKLSGGIAKLKVIGPSNGELREKRDRAEDAVFAVRGAVKHGCMPGGGWALKSLYEELSKNPQTQSDGIILNVLAPSLLEPMHRIYKNAGMNKEEEISAYNCVGTDNGVFNVYDAWESKKVDAIKNGILDSTPAVLEAIRSSLSIASLLGTLGGTVVFKRDDEMEKQEAVDTTSFMKTFEGQ